MGNLNIDIAAIQVVGGVGTPAGTFDDPYRIGDLRLWDDPVEDVLRTKRGVEPSAVDDGRVIEPAQPSGGMY